MRVVLPVRNNCYDIRVIKRSYGIGSSLAKFSSWLRIYLVFFVVVCAVKYITAHILYLLEQTLRQRALVV